MKKVMSSRNRKRTNSQNRQNLEIGTEAVKVLRTVGDHEAFYFYEAIDKPTGEIARNLSDFLDKVKYAKSETLVFHLRRKDFQNWVEKILGDSKLARELGGISTSNSGEIRMRIHETVENRIKELKGSSAIVLVDESSAVLLPAS